MESRIGLNRLSVLFLAVYLITGLIIVRLFYLQVISHGYYEEIAQSEQYGYTTLPARRGEILIEDYHSGESYSLATNTTLAMVFADPTLISEPDTVAETLTPLLFDLETERELEQKRYDEEYTAIMKMESEVLRNEALSKLKLKTDEELLAAYGTALEDTLADKTRDIILLLEQEDPDTIKEVTDLNLEGVEVTSDGDIYAYPAKIDNKKSAAEKLGAVLDWDTKDLQTVLQGTNRYSVLRRKLDPMISEQIETILKEDLATAKAEKTDPIFLGIRLVDEYFRFYPEQDLAAQILGYVSGNGGQYGIEGTYDEVLQGVDGIFTSKIDANGNQITVGDSIIENAVDGADVWLTIDRAIQTKVEEFLKAGVEEYRPDSGQVIVINPKTGAILAMAQYPSFNPNSFSDVFDKVEIDIPEDKRDKIVVFGSEEEPRYWYYLQVEPDVRIEIFKDPEISNKYYSYKNTWGPEVYKNKMIQEVYEPGSVFKPLVAAAAINAGEITASTTFMDTGAIGVDFNVYTNEYDYYIETFNKQYHGLETMTQVLEHSCNTGMTFISKKLGAALFYSYIKGYGLLQKTDIGLDDEVRGDVEHYDGWTESEMVTKAFGQGISMTPLQLIQAYTALANDGTMMQPYLVKKIEYADGSTEEFEPEIVSQVLKPETAQMVTAMLTSVVGQYTSQIALEDHYIAGKSGTAQTYKGNRVLSGPGTTITTFMGYGPIDDAEFLVLVKMDRPRATEWAEGTSGQVFHKIMEFLFSYYSIPPDKESLN
ncbi:MAG: penicillin-binding transpeptidase domain-containing protein [Candidatus Gracilibacteria bacterium]|jgi:cell division protein FtsI/penicillin-binding protein 2